MEFRKEKNVAANSSMFEGAIFMSNRSTKKECLKRKLFGFPPSQAPFVKRVKTGMILFLFEYEERKLYGVFEAASDGALNIQPHAFSSSGKPFTAQICFKRIWSCHPLSEPEFCDAIKDNYYTPKKFHLYLSQEQVCELLLLFSSKKIKIQRSPSLGTAKKVLKHSQKHGQGSSRVAVTSDSVGNELEMDNDLEPANLVRHPPKFFGLNLNQYRYPIPSKEGSVGEQLLSFPVSRSFDTPTVDFMPPMSWRDGTAMGDIFVSTQHSHRHYGVDPSFCYTQPSFSSHTPCDPTSMQDVTVYSRSSIDSVLPFSKHQPHMEPDTLDPSSSRHGRRDISVNLGGYKVPSALDCDEPSSASIPSLQTGYLENRSTNPKSVEDYINLSFTDRHEASGVDIPFSGARYFEKKSMGFRTDDDGYAGFSLTDHYEPGPSRPDIPLLQAAGFAKKSLDSTFIYSPSKNLSSVRDLGVHDYPAFYQYENHLGSKDGFYEASSAANHISGDGNLTTRTIEPSSFLSGLDKYQTRVEYVYPLTSHFDDVDGRMRHNGQTHYEEYHPEEVDTSLDLDHSEKRPSVFSRLSARADSSYQDGVSYESEPGADISISELLKILSKRRKIWRKPIKKSKPLNALNQEGQINMDLIRTNVQINEEDPFMCDGSVEMSSQSPFLNFKRRSEVQKTREETETRGQVEGEANEEPSSGKQKRRKLIRPPLRPEEHFDKETSEGVNLGGFSQAVVATSLTLVQTSEAKTDIQDIGSRVEDDRREAVVATGLTLVQTSEAKTDIQDIGSRVEDDRREAVVATGLTLVQTSKAKTDIQDTGSRVEDDRRDHSQRSLSLEVGSDSALSSTGGKNDSRNLESSSTCITNDSNAEG